MPRVIHDSPDKVYACPNCDSATDLYRHLEPDTQRSTDEIYRCFNCDATFATPVERDPQSQPPDLDGLPPGLSDQAAERIRKIRKQS